MKIIVACGSGLGSSFMIEMNIKKVVKEFGIEAEVTHTDLSTAKSERADIYVGTRDIADQLQDLGGDVVSLRSMIDFNELKQKLKEILEGKGLI